MLQHRCASVRRVRACRADGTRNRRRRRTHGRRRRYGIWAVSRRESAGGVCSLRNAPASTPHVVRARTHASTSHGCPPQALTHGSCCDPPRKSARIPERSGGVSVSREPCWSSVARAFPAEVYLAPARCRSPDKVSSEHCRRLKGDGIEAAPQSFFGSSQARLKRSCPIL